MSEGFDFDEFNLPNVIMDDLLKDQITALEMRALVDSAESLFFAMGDCGCGEAFAQVHSYASIRAENPFYSQARMYVRYAEHIFLSHEKICRLAEDLLSALSPARRIFLSRALNGFRDAGERCNGRHFPPPAEQTERFLAVLGNDGDKAAVVLEKKKYGEQLDLMDRLLRKAARADGGPASFSQWARIKAISEALKKQKSFDMSDGPSFKELWEVNSELAEYICERMGDA